MYALLDRAILLLFISLLKIIRTLPRGITVPLIAFKLKLLFIFLPSLKKVSQKNLALVFPSKTQAERDKILNASYTELARAVVDFARLPKVDKKWVTEHVEFPERLSELFRSDKGVLCVTGHLGSFDLFLQIVALRGFQGSIVIRELKFPLLNSWVNNYRAINGAGSFPRKGAIKKMLELLKDRQDVGILFDQNMRRDHAVFVPWFGKVAATTIATGFSALQTNCHLIVMSLQSLPNEKYKVLFSEIDIQDIREDETIERNVAIKKITERIVSEYEKMILTYPEGWFWMHRRWKTAPEGEVEDFYD